MHGCQHSKRGAFGAVMILLVHFVPAVADEVVDRCEVATERATLAADALREHFWNETSGLYEEILWWEIANTLEVTAWHASIAGNATLSAIVATDIANMFEKTNNMSYGGPYLTGYFDDEEWWALGWLEAWQLTDDPQYVNHTNTIFQHQVDKAWNESSCGGGVDWQGFIYSENRMGVPYKNAITNQLFLMIAAKMAVVGPEVSRAYYKEWAEREWAWLKDSGMMNSKSLYNDGLDQFAGHNDICRNNNDTEWTYNQGVILGGLAYMWELTNDDTLLSQATAIAAATMQHLVHDDGVLREPCEGAFMAYQQCSQDELQFKGVFVRYLNMLVRLAMRSAAALAALGGADTVAGFERFIAANADSIWAKAACTSAATLGVGEVRTALPLFGATWNGPCNNVPGGLTAVAQTSAMDVLVADMEWSCAAKRQGRLHQ